jgi:hypothetical protein
MPRCNVNNLVGGCSGQLGRLPFYWQRTQTQFALLVSGFSKKWMDNSQKALYDHQGYIAAEAASPVLVEAMVAFKEAWDSYRATDEERLLGLQIAYITLNEHPAGSKDQLDYASGSEEYHAVHKQYHPQYRAILYERNYYDIFMLDLEGNCIYSVYKELDYATNFRTDGLGEWKDSGLGEAYRAALEHPDEINVIDWKPYGLHRRWRVRTAIAKGQTASSSPFSSGWQPSLPELKPVGAGSKLECWCKGSSSSSRPRDTSGSKLLPVGLGTFESEPNPTCPGWLAAAFRSSSQTTGQPVPT